MEVLLKGASAKFGWTTVTPTRPSLRSYLKKSIVEDEEEYEDGYEAQKHYITSYSSSSSYSLSNPDNLKDGGISSAE
jgi:hypothetical protein